MSKNSTSKFSVNLTLQDAWRLFRESVGNIFKYLETRYPEEIYKVPKVPDKQGLTVQKNFQAKKKN